MTSSGDQAGSGAADSTGRLRQAFVDYGDFVARCGPHLCGDGMFLATDLPPTPGSSVRFRLELEDGVTLVQGEGEVLWERHRAPIGVGIRFVELDPLSLELVGRILARRKGPAFDLAAGPEAVVAANEVSFEESLVELSAEPLRAEIMELDATPEIFTPPEPIAAVEGDVQVDGDLSAEHLLADDQVAEQRPRRSLPLSPAAILLVALAGAAGGGTYFLLESIAGRVAGTSGLGEPFEPQIIDIPPLGVQPSVRTPDTKADGEGDRAESPSQEPVRPPAAATTAPPPAGPVEEAGEAAAEDLTRIRLVTWKEVAGDTVVTLWGDGALRRDDLSTYHIGGERPRELVKIRGIDWPLRDPILAAATGDLVQIRSGFHPKPQLNELHLVFDLTGPAVQLSSVEIDGSNLHLSFSRRK